MGIQNSNQVTRFISGFHLGSSSAGSLHSAESYIPHLTPPQLCSLVRRHGSLCPDISRSCNCSYLPPFSETWKWSVNGSPPRPLYPAHPLAPVLPHSASIIIWCLLSCPFTDQCQAERIRSSPPSVPRHTLPPSRGPQPSPPLAHHQFLYTEKKWNTQREHMLSCAPSFMKSHFLLSGLCPSLKVLCPLRALWLQDQELRNRIQTLLRRGQSAV